jgi:hypothetical protein
MFPFNNRKAIGIMQKLRLSTALLLMLLAACATTKHPSPVALQAASPITGEQYYRKAMEYAQDESYWQQPFAAFHLFRKAAELGHVAAQDQTAWGYQIGMGTDKDLSQAAAWYRRAAEAGYADSQNSLGLFLYLGMGGDIAREEAYDWIHKSASQSNPAGLSNMGAIYEAGDPVAQDYTMAAHYYRRAADLDYVLAKSNLGGLYLNGRGVDKDADTAFRLFQEGCMANHRWGFVGCYKELEHAGEMKLDASEFERAQTILEKACRDGQGLACEYAGYLYLNGWWVNLDLAKAAGYFQQACTMGAAVACGVAGEMYFFGHGVGKDRDLAEILLAEACEHEDAVSCGLLVIIQTGLSTKEGQGSSQTRK